MDPTHLKNLLKENLTLLDAACAVLQASETQSKLLVGKSPASLSSAEGAFLEALTSRFARVSDLLFARVFRTLDQIELIDEGTAIDRINRMEKRGLLKAEEWRRIKALRNEIAHEYLIESSDAVVKESFEKVTVLLATTEKIKKYVAQKQYL